MHIAVVGAGAIGCMFGIRLHKSGQQVLLLHHRRRVVDWIRRKGVSLRETTGQVVRARVEAKSSLSRSNDVELVLVTVKAYDTERVARILRRSVKSDTVVLSLQNGLGNVETLSRHLRRVSILGGSTTEGAMSLGPGTVLHTGTGRTWVGELDGETSNRCLTIKNLFHKAGFETELSRNIEGVLWAKAIVNSAINPIAALTRLPNGDLRSVPRLRQIASLIVEEGIAVGRANAVLLADPDPKTLLSRVLSSTAQNRSSMLQDIERGRPTEIRQLNNAISVVGRRHGVSTPYNNFLTTLIMGLERKRNQISHRFPNA